MLKEKLCVYMYDWQEVSTCTCGNVVKIYMHLTSLAMFLFVYDVLRIFIRPCCNTQMVIHINNCK